MLKWYAQQGALTADPERSGGHELRDAFENQGRQGTCDIMIAESRQ
jgi:hypothetical protein